MITIPVNEQVLLTVKRTSGVVQDPNTGFESAGSPSTIFTGVIGMAQPADIRLIESELKTVYQKFWSIFFQIPRDVRQGDEISWTDPTTGGTLTVRAERITPHNYGSPLDHTHVLAGVLSETP
jgi:hypothetical protein